MSFVFDIEMLIYIFFFCIYWLCAFIPDWLYAIRRELAFYGEKSTLFLDFLIWACLCAHSLLGIYSVIWCYFIDFISSLQIILFVCGSKNRVKSVCVYEPAPRFCKRLFIINRNRYSAGKDHLLKNNQPDTKTNSAKKKFIPNCRCKESHLLKCVWSHYFVIEVNLKVLVYFRWVIMKRKVEMKVEKFLGICTQYFSTPLEYN